MRITRFAVAPAPLQLLPPSVRRHPEELVSNQLGAGKERDRGTAGIIGIFFRVQLSLGKTYGVAQTRLIYF